jgi:hypothetical protein
MQSLLITTTTQQVRDLLREARTEAAHRVAALSEVKRDIEQEEQALALPPRARAALYNEAHLLQAELATWAAAVATRAAEAADVDTGLSAVTALRDRLVAAAAATEALVAVAREELPGAVAVIMGASHAADVALELAGESEGGFAAATSTSTAATSSAAGAAGAGAANVSVYTLCHCEYICMTTGHARSEYMLEFVCACRVCMQACLCACTILYLHMLVLLVLLLLLLLLCREVY